MKLLKKKLVLAVSCALSALTISQSVQAAAPSIWYDGSYATVFAKFRSQWMSTISSGLVGGSIAASMAASQAAIIQRIQLLEEQLLKKLDESDSGITSQLESSTSEMRQRIKKVGQAQIQGAGVIALDEEEREFRRQVQKTMNDYEQPLTNCLSMAAANSFSKGVTHARAMAAKQARYVANSVAHAGKSGKSEWEIEEYETNKSLYGNDKSYLNAALLFGSSNGSLTRTLEDTQKIGSVINFLTGLAYVPKVYNPEQDKLFGDNGKRLSAIQRDNAAFIGLESYILNTAAYRHEPNMSLISFFKASKLDLTPEQEANGVSISELFDTYVKKLMNKNFIAQNATATAPTILRSMSQTDSISLYMELENLKDLIKQEAVSAAELSVLTHKIMGPMLDTQYQKSSFK